MVFKKKQIALFIICLFFLINISPIHVASFENLVPTNGSTKNFIRLTNGSSELSYTFNISYNFLSANSEGKTALVTGGSRGIGAGIARKLASAGTSVAIIRLIAAASTDLLQIRLECTSSASEVA